MAFKFLKGQDLIAVLSRTDQGIRWIDTATGGLIGTIPANVAINMVKASTYVGKCTDRRCYHIKEVDDRRPVIRDDYYRVGRAMLQPYGVTTATVDAWDRHFDWLETQCRK